MHAEFSIWALDDPHLREEMEMVRAVLDDQGIQYKMNHMSTTIEGSFGEISAAVAACHSRLGERHKRLLTQITIDDDRAD